MALRAGLSLISVPLAGCAVALSEQQGWRELGFARQADYARERLGRSVRWLRDLACLGAGLRRHPNLATALSGSGGDRPLGRVAALAALKAAGEGLLEPWLALARQLTIRELRRRASASTAAPSHTSTNVKEMDETDDERHLVRLPVPTILRAILDEVLELYRAVNGHEETMASFCEAVVAEAFAGPHPPDAEAGPMLHRPGQEAVEGALASSTGRWCHLGRPPDSDATSQGQHAAQAAWNGPEILSTAMRVLARLQLLSAEAGGGGAVALDRQLIALLQLEDELERLLGRLLATMSRQGAWARLRFAGVGHYSEERLGLSRTTGQNRSRLSRSLASYEVVRQAYEGGRIGFEAALLIVRMLEQYEGRGAGPDRAGRRQLQARWIERAEAATIKRLRDEMREVGRRSLGDQLTPTSGYGVHEATVPAGSDRVQGAGPLSDACWHASLHRQPGRARLRVSRLAGRLAERRHTDDCLRLRLPVDLASSFLAAIECSRRQLVDRAASTPWNEEWPEPDPPASLCVARMFAAMERRLPGWVGLLAMLEDFVSTWDDPRGSPRRHGEATYRRDGWRCTAPGCTSRRNLEEHHVDYRSRGGSDAADNLTCVCAFHHRMGEHGLLASCVGVAPLGLTWTLGRHGSGGRYLNEIGVPAGTP